MAKLRRKLQFQEIIADATSKAITTTGVNLKARILRPGCTVKTGGSTTVAVELSVAVYHPWRVNVGDLLYTYDPDFTTMSTFFWTVTTAPTFSAGGWMMGITPSDDASLSTGDKLVLVAAVPGEATVYSDDTRDDSVSQPIDIGADSGLLEVWVEELAVDLVILNSSNVPLLYYAGVRTEGETLRISPRYFGAGVNGTADDSDAIQRAVDVLATTEVGARGEVYLDGGLWRLDSAVDVNGDDIGFVGDGFGTQIVCAGGGFSSDGYDRISFRDMRLDLAAGVAGIAVSNGDEIELEGLRLGGGSKGIYIDTCTEVFMDDVRTKTQTFAGIEVIDSTDVHLGDRMFYSGQTGTASLYVHGTNTHVTIGAGARYKPTSGRAVLIQCATFGDATDIRLLGGDATGGNSEHFRVELVDRLMVGSVLSAGATSGVLRLVGCQHFVVAVPMAVNPSATALVFDDDVSTSPVTPCADGVIVALVDTGGAQNSLDLNDTAQRIAVVGGVLRSGNITSEVTTADCVFVGNILEASASIETLLLSVASQPHHIADNVEL